jgi:predicted CoA-binding protein
MQKEIESFIASRNVAVVGVSTSGKKFGNVIYRTLKSRGFNVLPVHPSAETLEEDRCYPDLAGLPEGYDAAVIATSPVHAAGVVDKAIEGQIKKIWFQQGADFSEAIERARAAGMDVVSGKCILLYAPPVTGLHGVHRFFARLLGTL